MRRVLASLILITAFVVAAATAHAFLLMDPSTWNWPQYDWSSFKLQDPNSWPLIPVPEVATDPNGGVTYGILPVWLFTDNKHEISGIRPPISTPTVRSDRVETFVTWPIPRRTRSGTRSRARKRQSRARSISITRPGASIRTGGRLKDASFSSAIRPSASTDRATTPTRATRPTTPPSSFTARRLPL